ncbi:UDP-glucose dehydrogenase family protein [Paenibacillus sp. FSL K6-2524]|uniref:UDP-glucose dehydrogenase family protein n=1 Tax=Paenibacillus sp. FSL K6-2524 TaxID=2954516 RepID=UPI0030F7431F
MKITVIGTGYVGITTAASLGEIGHQIIGVDIDKLKIEQLNNGILPIYEPGVEPVIQNLLKQGTLHFTTSLQEAMKETEIIFIAVGTPQLSDGRPDLKYVDEVAREVGRYMSKYIVIVDKSTVPVGTAERVQSLIMEQLNLRKLSVSFDVVSNPEFLQEGKALQNSRNPDRIVLGCSSRAAEEIMLKLYDNIDAPKHITSPRNAEMIKYASNSFLATKITFINEMARLCDLLAVDVVEVAKGMGMDKRIGPYFLQAGIGYGGSCFPKDVSALAMMGREANMEMSILRSIQEINQTQTDWFLGRVKESMGVLDGKRITLLGLAFKPDTDDIREAPSLKLIQKLLTEGAIVTGFDPVANNKIKNIFPNVKISEDAYSAAKDAEAVVICTEWKEIIDLDWRTIKSLMHGNFIFDGRNALDGDMLQLEEFQYWGVGRSLNKIV